MRDTEVLVRFRPSGAEAYVLPGTRLVEAAAEAGIVLDVPCGGEGLCGKCRVIVASGAGEPTPVERDWFSAEELRAGWRLACQSAVARADGSRDSAALAAAEPQIRNGVESLVSGRRAGPRGGGAKRVLTPCRSAGAEAIRRTSAADARRRPARRAAAGAGDWRRTAGNRSCAAARNLRPAAPGRLPRHGRAGRRPPVGLRAGQYRGRRLRRRAGHRHHHAGRRVAGPRHGQPAGRSMPGSIRKPASATTSFRASFTPGKRPTACGSCTKRSRRPSTR